MKRLTRLLFIEQIITDSVYCSLHSLCTKLFQKFFFENIYGKKALFVCAG